MAIAQGSQNSAWYIEEVTPNVLPATPAWKPILRKPGNGVGMTRDTIESETVDGTGFARCSSNGNKNITGSFECEDFFTAHDDLLSYAFGADWETDQPSVGKSRLKAGMVRQTFSIEEKFADISQYQRFSGCEVSSVNLKVAPNTAPMLTFNILGRSAPAMAQVIVTGATYGTPTTNCPFTSFSGYLKEGGATLAVVTGVDATLDRGLDPNFVVFNDESQTPSAKLLSFKGTISFYFESEAIYNKWVNSTESTLEMQLVDPAGNSRTVFVPRARYTNMTINRSGLGSITINGEFEAQKDGVSGTNVYLVTDAA